MSKPLIGFLAVVCISHLILVAIPLTDTLRARISAKSKLAWSAFLLLLPFIGVVVFHRYFRSGFFLGDRYEISAAEERARSGTLAPGDDD